MIHWNHAFAGLRVRLFIKAVRKSRTASLKGSEKKVCLLSPVEFSRSNEEYLPFRLNEFTFMDFLLLISLFLSRKGFSV